METQQDDNAAVATSPPSNAEDHPPLLTRDELVELAHYVLGRVWQLGLEIESGRIQPLETATRLRLLSQTGEARLRGEQ